jgi:tetratricopeptide (TPR) repeat protein
VHQSLVAAVAAASGARRWDDAHQLAAGLAGYQGFRHLTDDGIAVATLGLAAARHLGRRQECGSEMRLGDAYQIAGRHAEAVGHLEHALQLRPANDATAEGSIRHNLGLAYLRLGRFAEAEACHRRDLAICREAGDWRGAGEAMIALGDALQELRRFREAVAVLNTAVETFELTGDLRNVELARTNLALTCLNGFPDTRAAYIIWQLCMALKAARDLDDRKGQALILLNLASAFLNRCRGCHGRSAAQSSLRAAEMFHELGDSLWEERAARNNAIAKSQGDETAHEGCPGDGIPGSANLRAWLDDLPHAVLRGADSRLDEARFFGNYVIGPTPDGSPLPDELLRRNKTGLLLTAEDLTGDESVTILGGQAGLDDAAAAQAVGAALGHDRGAVVMAAAFLRKEPLSASAFIERLSEMTVDDDPGRPAGPGSAGAAKVATLAVQSAEQAAPHAGRVLDVLALLASGSVDKRRLAREFSACDTADIDAAIHALADTAAIVIDGNEITANPAAARIARSRAVRLGTILDSAARATRMVESEIFALEGTAVPVARVAALNQQINTMWATVAPELAGGPAQDTGTWAGTADMMRLRTWQVNFLAQSAGRPADAAELGDTVLDDCTRLLGESHQETWRARNNLAGVYFVVGDFDRACALFSRNLPAGDTSADHQDRLLTHHNLGVAHERAGRPKRAAQVLAGVLADRERILGTRHPGTLETRHWLGVANAGVGNLPEAMRLLEEAAAGRRSLGRPSVELAVTLEVLAELYARSGMTNEALQAREESVAIKEEVCKPGNTGVIMARDELAELYMRTRRFKKAIMLLTRNFTEAEQTQGPDPFCQTDVTHGM